MIKKLHQVLWIAYSLLTYRISKLVTVLFSSIIEGVHPIAVSATFWILLALWPSWKEPKKHGFDFNIDRIKKVKKELIWPLGALLAGLLIFIFSGITARYFHSVAAPFVFILITPLVEEAIFRGWVWAKFEERLKGWIVPATALLFSLHHLEFYNFQISNFVVFQLIYTFALGMILGRVRILTGSIYLGLILHILINFLSFTF